MKKVTFLEQPLARMAYPASASWLRAVIAPDQVGVYMMLRNTEPFYVGRSDHCVLRRLLHHEKLAEASHFLWQRCRNIEVAYHIEAFWYDHLAPGGSILNKVHPAKPIGHQQQCPFCTITHEHVSSILPKWSEN